MEIPKYFLLYSVHTSFLLQSNMQHNKHTREWM